MNFRTVERRKSISAKIRAKCKSKTGCYKSRKIANQRKAVLIQETGQYWRVYHCPVKNHYHLTTKEI